ncbi:hypothetical protein [Spirosoma koreense]
MKILWFCLVGLSLVVGSSCKKPVEPAASGPFLKTVVETRNLPDDSLTITYQYDPMGRQLSESYQGNYKPSNIHDIYSPSAMPAPSNTTDQYRLHILDAQNREVAVKRYFAQYGSHWSVFDSDTMAYEANRLVRQEHKDFFFIVDGMGLAFNYPLWVTRRRFTYDPRQHIRSAIDSVFITHDMPAGTVVLANAPATFLYTNQTTYDYDDQGKVVTKTAVSNDPKKPMVYSNGWALLDTEGRGYAASVRMRFTPGITTYAYEYDAAGQLTRKTATYTANRTAQPYVSTFIYEYGMSQ